VGIDLAAALREAEGPQHRRRALRRCLPVRIARRFVAAAPRVTRSGERRYNNAAREPGVARNMTAEEIERASEYCASRPPEAVRAFH
jgi:hypothetical protein